MARASSLFGLCSLALLTACGGGGGGDEDEASGLAALATSAGILDPTFAPDALDYTVDVGRLAVTVSVTPTAADPAAVVRVEGVPTSSGTPSQPLALGGAPRAVSIEVTEPDGGSPTTYELLFDPRPAVAQEAYVKASNTDRFDDFGFSVAISGDTMVVGATLEDSSATGVNGNQADDGANDAGAAYVFVRNGTTWTQQAYLKASNTGAEDNFGFGVAISGDTIVVGAPGEDGGATGVNGNQADESVFEAGAAYVFVRTGTTWTQQAYLKASNTGSDQYGESVAVSGDVIVVSSHGEDSNATTVNGDPSNDLAIDSGAAYVYVRTGTTWTQQAYLKASNAEAFDEFGFDVAVSGETVVVGARLEDGGTTGVNGNAADDFASASGAAYVFVRNGTVWSQQAYLKASNTDVNDVFGFCVALSGDTIVVGAQNEDSDATGVNGDAADDSAAQSGAAYVFVRVGTTWSQQAYLKASNTGAGDIFGKNVAVDGDTIVVSAQAEDSRATGVDGNQADEAEQDAGAAYAFVRSGTTWTQAAYLKASNTFRFDAFGIGVAVSGDTVVAGAFTEDGDATGVNGDPFNDDAASSGAVYVVR